MVHMKKDLSDNETLIAKVLDILNELKAEDKKSTNTTDPDCKVMHSVQGSHSAYNVQSAVDEKHGLIVNSDVVNENNDIHQFAEQVEQANETLKKKCQAACADAGYSSVDELEKIDGQGIKVVVPSQKQALKEKKENPALFHSLLKKLGIDATKSIVDVAWLGGPIVTVFGKSSHEEDLPYLAVYRTSHLPAELYTNGIKWRFSDYHKSVFPLAFPGNISIVKGDTLQNVCSFIRQEFTQ
jgi:hypothetical protein